MMYPNATLKWFREWCVPWLREKYDLERLVSQCTSRYFIQRVDVWSLARDGDFEGHGLLLFFDTVCRRQWYFDPNECFELCDTRFCAGTYPNYRGFLGEISLIPGYTPHVLVSQQAAEGLQEFFETEVDPMCEDRQVLTAFH